MRSKILMLIMFITLIGLVYSWINRSIKEREIDAELQQVYAEYESFMESQSQNNGGLK